jgi:predicted NUDIX family NTP pyrophosphohydrolase
MPGDNLQVSFNGQPLSLNKSKPAMGKLVLLLGGICTGTGAGGFESFVKQYGFHVFAPKTQTCVNSAPDKYKDIIKTTPNDPEANRQVGDARMELWDGIDRVDWVTVNKGESIVEQTLGAIQYGMTNDPGGDWGFFLNSDGTLRTTDVWVVGYSWGSQSWAMMSSYVRFGRVITTSGPVAEGFPNAAWITHPSATPGDRKYLLVGLKSPYPSADPGDSGDMEKFTNVLKAGWTGTPTNVMPTGTGTFTAEQHLFAMIGSNNTSPGGHTVFCTDNSMNGWLPVCKHVLGMP